MIINTGGRTDTVQYYTPWLLNRFDAGNVLVRNPYYPNSITRYELDPSVVDCVIFCSKNYSPILPHIKRIIDRFNTYFFYTITAYGTDVEPGVPDIKDGVRTLIELSKLVGRERLAWRYDPILLTERYTVRYHCELFARLASHIVPHVDRCIFSFVEMYRKVGRNMKSIITMTDDERAVLLRSMGDSARKYDLRLHTCACGDDLSSYGIEGAGCVTLETIAQANDVRFKRLKHKGMRKGCGCFEWHDIGAYDSCPNGCAYCYANSTAKRAAENYELHDPESPLLLGNIKEGDVIRSAAQKSYRTNS